jgi:lipoprotein-anchoring transpeptidase ErfK/SrfK
MQLRLRLLCALPVVGLLAGCGATAEQVARSQSLRGTHFTGYESAREQPAPTTSRCRGVIRRVGSSQVSVVAVVRGRARAYLHPGRRVLADFGRLNQNGFPNVFRVLASVRSRDCRTAWYHVQLPLRPNGITGYVPARAVEIGRVRTRIAVDLSSRRLTLFRDGERTLRVPVAVGSPASPTPTGRYYINQKLIARNPSGPYGPGALGISAFSPVLTGWAQGGPVAIHGTNEPWSIGRAASHGCVRVRNSVLRRLFAATPAGTPVVIER